MKTFEDRKQKVTTGIVAAFKAQFPDLVPQEDFETIWPLSVWDIIHTDTRTFNVKLKLTTGKVIEFIEEV